MELERLEGYVDDLLEMDYLLSQRWGRKLDSTPKTPSMDVHVQFLRQQTEALQRRIQEVMDELNDFIRFLFFCMEVED